MSEETYTVELSDADVSLLMLALAAVRILMKTEGTRLRGRLVTDSLRAGVTPPDLTEAAGADLALRIAAQVGKQKEQRRG